MPKLDHFKHKLLNYIHRKSLTMRLVFFTLTKALSFGEILFCELMNNLKKIRSFCILCSLFVVMPIFDGCKSNPFKPSYDVPVDKYIFLEREVIFDGVIVEGNYFGPLAEHRITYSFDSTQGTLSGLVEFPITDNLIGICGFKDRLSGAAGTGAISKLFGIFSLPYQKNSFTLLSVNPDESISFKHQDSVIVLARAGEFKIINSRLDTIETAIVLFTTSEIITNHGLQSKSNIHKYSE